jgi:protein ImuB
MRLWIGVHLPLLSLEAFRPRWSEPGRHVVVNRLQVLTVSDEAFAAGVRVGMRRGGVGVLCPDAVLHEHDETKERVALDTIALTLLQYTPEVALAEEASLLLDVSASLRFFGGPRVLHRRVRESVQSAGFTPQIGMAPTAQGAWLLARAFASPSAKAMAGGERPKQRRVLRIETLMKRLAPLPCALLPAIRPFREWLDGIGCQSFGDLRKLPRAGLKRRTRPEALDALDRAYGEATELFDWVQAPETFCAKLELPDRIEHAEAVLFAARRLLLQMAGWMVARHLAVTHFLLAMEHERGRYAIAPTILEIKLAEAAWHEEHLTHLLKERLGRVELQAAVIALRLEAMQTEAMAPPTESLFPEPGGTKADRTRLLELLTARLGEDNVLLPAPHADHRPEQANRWLPATAVKRLMHASLPPLNRPFWLLDVPIQLIMRDHRPFYGSPLRIVSAAERIECGWQDDALVVRDYFVAQGEESACYWVYRERAGEDIRWYLHGLFA